MCMHLDLVRWKCAPPRKDRREEHRVGTLRASTPFYLPLMSERFDAKRSCCRSRPHRARTNGTARSGGRRTPRMRATPRPIRERRSVHGREHGDVTIGRFDVTSFDACMAERAQGMAHDGAVHPRGGWLLACQSQDLGASTRPNRGLAGPSRRCNAAAAAPGRRKGGQALAAAAYAGATGNECRWVRLELA